MASRDQYRGTSGFGTSRQKARAPARTGDANVVVRVMARLRAVVVKEPRPDATNASRDDIVANVRRPIRITTMRLVAISDQIVVVPTPSSVAGRPHRNHERRQRSKRRIYILQRGTRFERHAQRDIRAGEPRRLLTRGALAFFGGFSRPIHQSLHPVAERGRAGSFMERLRF